MYEKRTFFYRNSTSLHVPVVASAGDSVAYTNFIARTSGLDASHLAAYRDLLNGLTTDGLFNTDGTTNYFDVLHIYATQDTTTAQLNLVSASFPAGLNGAPTFTQDRGYTGQDDGIDDVADKWIDTGFNPTTAPSPKYTRNSAHTSVWSNTNAASSALGSGIIGATDVAGGVFSDLHPKYSDGNCSIWINESSQIGTAQFANANSTGHYLGNRSNSTTTQGYINAVDKGITGSVSAGPANANIMVLSTYYNGAARSPSALQTCMASIGSSLTQTQVTNFYNRLRTYMTAAGVP